MGGSTIWTATAKTVSLLLCNTLTHTNLGHGECKIFVVSSCESRELELSFYYTVGFNYILLLTLDNAWECEFWGGPELFLDEQ